MESFYYILFIVIISILERFREIIDFKSWFATSPFSRIKNERIYKWFRSNDEDEFRKWYLFKNFNVPWLAASYIPMHPIFWDAYHFFKNLSFAVIVIWVGWESGFIWMTLAAVLVYCIQEGMQHFLVKKT